MTTATEKREKYWPLLATPTVACNIRNEVQTQDRRPLTKRNSDGNMWDRLEFDDSKIPDDLWRTSVDTGFGYGWYLHVPCRPHPEDPQTADYWTGERVYSKWSIGDRLYIRERFKIFALAHCDDAQIEYSDGQLRDVGPNSGDIPDDYLPAYFKMIDKSRTQKKSITVPAIITPRWASRTLVEITDIRVQGVQEISDEDIIAEGVTPDLATDHPRGVHYTAWITLWNSLYGNFNANPWVWATTFKKHTPA